MQPYHGGTFPLPDFPEDFLGGMPAWLAYVRLEMPNTWEIMSRVWAVRNMSKYRYVLDEVFPGPGTDHDLGILSIQTGLTKNFISNIIVHHLATIARTTDIVAIKIT